MRYGTKKRQGENYASNMIGGVLTIAIFLGMLLLMGPLPWEVCPENARDAEIVVSSIVLDTVSKGKGRSDTYLKITDKNTGETYSFSDDYYTSEFMGFLNEALSRGDRVSTKLIRSEHIVWMEKDGAELLALEDGCKALKMRAVYESIALCAVLIIGVGLVVASVVGKKRKEAEKKRWPDMPY